MADEYSIDERMMLVGRAFHEGELIGEDIALNDIVISREGRLRVLKFINYVNGEYLNVYNADGVIVSTPTVPPVTVCRQGDRSSLPALP